MRQGLGTREVQSEWMFPESNCMWVVLAYMSFQSERGGWLHGCATRDPCLKRPWTWLYGCRYLEIVNNFWITGLANHVAAPVNEACLPGSSPTWALRISKGLMCLLGGEYLKRHKEDFNIFAWSLLSLLYIRWFCDLKAFSCLLTPLR